MYLEGLVSEGPCICVSRGPRLCLMGHVSGYCPPRRLVNSLLEKKERVRRARVLGTACGAASAKYRSSSAAPRLSMGYRSMGGGKEGVGGRIGAMNGLLRSPSTSVDPSERIDLEGCGKIRSSSRNRMLHLEEGAQESNHFLRRHHDGIMR